MQGHIHHFLQQESGHFENPRLAAEPEDGWLSVNLSLRAPLVSPATPALPPSLPSSLPNIKTSIHIIRQQGSLARAMADGCPGPTSVIMPALRCCPVSPVKFITSLLPIRPPTQHRGLPSLCLYVCTCTRACTGLIGLKPRLTCQADEGSMEILERCSKGRVFN